MASPLTHPSSRPTSRNHSRRNTQTTSSKHSASSEDSWLTHTASALAMHTLEEKGQSWLASRHSATSLSSLRDEYPAPYTAKEKMDSARSPVYPRSMPASRYASRVGSRVGGRVGSRKGSRVDLRMTSQLILSGFESAVGVGLGRKGGGEVVEGMEPDFVGLGDEEDDGGGGMKAGREADGVEKGEMRRLVLGRVGGWVDWMVGWMDLRGEVDDEVGEEVDEDEAREQEGGDTGRHKGGIGDQIGEGTEGGIAPPAPGNGGVWDDARWLMRIAAESL